MRVRTGAGDPALMVIEVSRDGTVCASLGATAMQLEPCDVSRLVRLYRLAQARALWIRGRW